MPGGGHLAAAAQAAMSLAIQLSRSHRRENLVASRVHPRAGESLHPVSMKTSPQDRPGGLSDRPGVPTERLSRHISIGIDSSDTKGYYRSVLKWSSYNIYIITTIYLYYDESEIGAMPRAACSMYIQYQ